MSATQDRFVFFLFSTFAKCFFDGFQLEFQKHFLEKLKKNSSNPLF